MSTKTIHKYTIKGHALPFVEIRMPVGAEILSIQSQDNNITFWALIDKDAFFEIRKFIIYGTGWDIKETDLYGKYLATVQCGLLVWHVFERLREEVR